MAPGFLGSQDKSAIPSRTYLSLVLELPGNPVIEWRGQISKGTAEVRRWGCHKTD